VDPELPVDVAQVVLDGARGEEQARPPRGCSHRLRRQRRPRAPAVSGARSRLAPRWTLSRHQQRAPPPAPGPATARRPWPRTSRRRPTGPGVPRSSAAAVAGARRAAGACGLARTRRSPTRGARARRREGRPRPRRPSRRGRARERSSAVTSGSWGCGSSGSQKKTSMSIAPSTIWAPICRSPPSGPLATRSTASSRRSWSRLPVVPVATSRWRISVSTLNLAHSSRSFLRLSCATRAMRRAAALPRAA
jgi:hypothetical protein